MTCFLPDTWSIYVVDDVQLAGRTINCLERYNRRLGERCLSAHLNLISYITAQKSKLIIIPDT
ncbi:hypothetical protein MXB_792 [Myxobolus squamalis]|nr:hypothetical protein MXB_792 [Myxobolus squamalis]